MHLHDKFLFIQILLLLTLENYRLILQAGYEGPFHGESVVAHRQLPVQAEVSDAFQLQLGPRRVGDLKSFIPPVDEQV